MLAIYKKEMRSYFINPIGYVYLAVFLAISAFICCMTTLQSKTCNTSTYFLFILFSFIILVPLLTMKLFSEEKKLRTEQLLMTAPVSIFGMVFAKYLAAMTMFAGSLLVSCVNFIPVFMYSPETNYAGVVIGTKVNVASLVGNLIAVLLVGSAFVAIGLFISSLTENQLVAAVATIGVLVFLLVIGFANQYIDSYPIRTVISWISIFNRFQSFTNGFFVFNDLLYYLSITAVFIFLTVRIFEKRRWA